MYFILRDKLTEAGRDQIQQGDLVVIAVRREELSEQLFTPEMNTVSPLLRGVPITNFCKAEVYEDGIRGTFCIPIRKDYKEKIRFSYIIGKQILLFVDDTGFVQACLKEIAHKKMWEKPGIGRLFYDFLEEMTVGDRAYLEGMEGKVSRLEDEVFGKKYDHFNHQLMGIHKEIMALSHYYMQLTELSAKLEEDENDLFDREEERLFQLFRERVHRLREETQVIREYCMQVREVYHAQIDIRQNRIMGMLTVVTTIFMPLTLIAGWYGMNFQYMPELSWKYGYPAIVLLSAAVVVICILYFKKKKYF